MLQSIRLICEVHDSYNALNNVAGLHVMMAIDNCDWFEVLAFNRAGDHSLGHMDYWPHRPSARRARDVHAPGPGSAGAVTDCRPLDSAVLAVAS